MNYIYKIYKNYSAYIDTLRSYMDKAINNLTSTIQKELEDNYLWLTIDETTDSQKWHLINIIAGTLVEENSKVLFALI